MWTWTWIAAWPWACAPRDPGPPAPAVEPPPDAVPLNVPPATEVLSFQWHVLPDVGFDGIIDAMIREDQPDTNFGTTDPFYLEATPGQAKSALVAWTIDAIPPGSVVVGASVGLRVVQTGPGPQEVYPVLRAWDYDEATWSCASGFCDDRWETPGARGVSDRGLRVGTVDTSALGWTTVAMGEVGLQTVQGWVDRPDTNFGLVIEGTADRVAIRSNDVSEPTDRPVLTVEFVPSVSLCPVFSPLAVGAIEAPSAVSGIVGARRPENRGVLFALPGAPDDDPVVLATDGAGAVQRTLTLPVTAGDLTGFAIGPAAETASGSYLYVGDLGPRRAVDDLRIWRFPEPDLATAEPRLDPDAFVLRFPPWDPEADGYALLVSQNTADLYVVTARDVYRYPELVQQPDFQYELFIHVPLTTFRDDPTLDAMGVPPDERDDWRIPRGGAIDPASRWIALRTRRELWIWLADAVADPLGLLGRPPDCVQRVDDGGTALGIDPNGQDLLTVGPGRSATLTRWFAGG
ncbi:MAG: DNRLRE domain-containing protein [Myxococcota bacterium]